MNQLHRIITAAGNAQKLATTLGVSPKVISNWKKRGIPKDWVQRLEAQYPPGAQLDIEPLPPALLQVDGVKPKTPKKIEKPIDWAIFDWLCNTYRIIRGTGMVWDNNHRQMMQLKHLAIEYDSRLITAWRTAENRSVVFPENVVFDPTMKAGPNCINLFQKIVMKPEAGDVEPILELIRYLTSRTSEHGDEADAHMHWLLQWLAYPLQHLGAKLQTAVIMHGDEGAGKNFLFDLVASIYGKHASLVGQDELEDRFNDWRSQKLFVVGDEVTSKQELVHNKNRLKALITSESVQINTKNEPRRTEKNQMNIVFLSNEIKPLELDNTDRRYMVIYTPRAKDVAFYQRLGAWRDNKGAEAFYAYLLAYPTDDFNIFAKAPLTDSKRDLIAINRKSPELFWLAWSNGEIDLAYWPCSTAQVYRCYLKWCHRTGDKFAFRQMMFMRMMVRTSEASAKPVREKIVDQKNGIGVWKSERMILTVEPPPTGIGNWASDCREAFDKEVLRYIGHEGISQAVPN